MYSESALAFTLSKQTLIGLVNFSVRAAPSHSLLFQFFFSLFVAISLTLTFARTMLLYENWSKRRGLKLSASTNMRGEVKDMRGGR